jgi:Flp pilus assembly pilin Flp
MNTPSKSVLRHTSIRKLHSDDRGLTTVEYVIVLVLIAAASIGTWVSFGGKVKAKLVDANTQMDDVHR